MIDETRDKDYFERRAEAEILAAQASSHAAVVRAHYELAGHYLDLVHNPEKQMASQAAEPDRPGGMIGFQVIGASARS